MAIMKKTVEEIEAIVKIMGIVVESKNKTAIKRIMEKDYGIPPEQTASRINDMISKSKLIRKNKNGYYYLTPAGREKLSEVSPASATHAYLHSNKWHIRPDLDTPQSNVMELMLMCDYDVNFLKGTSNVLAEMGIGYIENEIDVYNDEPREILRANQYGDKRYITSRVIKRILTSKKNMYGTMDDNSQGSLIKGIVFADRNIYYVYKEQRNKKWNKKNESRIVTEVEKQLKEIQSNNVYQQRADRGNLSNALVIVDNPTDAVKIYKESKYIDVYNEVYVIDKKFVCPEKIMIILESAKFTEDNINIWLNENIDTNARAVNIELITQRMKNITMIKDFIHTQNDIMVNVICLKTQGVKVKKYFTAKELEQVNIRELTTKEEIEFLTYISNDKDYALSLINRLEKYETAKANMQKNGILAYEKRVEAEKSIGGKHQEILYKKRMDRKVERRIKKIEEELGIKITASWTEIEKDNT